jgi:sigma-E factor negative regulatory protein RseC
LLETRATVVQIESQSALVQADQGNGCEQCNGKGCGSSKLTQMFCSTPRRFQVDNLINAKVGDEVIVAVADGAVLRGIGLVYLLPLLSLIAGGTLGSVSATRPELSDGYAAVGALLGLLAGFVLARWLASHRARQLNQPHIVRLWRGD